MRSVCVLIVITMLMLVAGAAMASTTPYATSSTGDLLTGWLSSGDGGLDGTGAWVAGTDGQYANIVWNIQREGNAYRYHYDMSVPIGAFSHLLFGVSDKFKSSDLWGVVIGGKTWSADDISIKTFSSTSDGKSNPNLPAPFYGVKFDSVSQLLGDGATSISVDFYSSRVPTWRNFYSKDGNAGHLGQNSLWNGALTEGGDARFMIAAPDTKVVPEPSTVLALLTGAFGLGGMFVRRRK